AGRRPRAGLHRPRAAALLDVAPRVTDCPVPVHWVRGPQSAVPTVVRGAGPAPDGASPRRPDEPSVPRRVADAPRGNLRVRAVDLGVRAHPEQGRPPGHHLALVVSGARGDQPPGALAAAADGHLPGRVLPALDRAGGSLPVLPPGAGRRLAAAHPRGVRAAAGPSRGTAVAG